VPTTTAKTHPHQPLHAHATTFVRTHAPKIYTRELVDMLFVQPYCRIQNLVEADIAKRQTASVYLKQLADAGMLRETKVGREKLFIHPNFVRLLTSDDHPVLPYGTDVSHTVIKPV
jgi:Fic family protein